MARDTRDRILDAASRLFAASESQGVSLRAIARAAGVNSALIHYHFGSREGLYEAVLLRALAPVQARRRALIERLRNGPPPVTALDLARLFVDPLRPGAPPDSPETEQAVTALRLLARAFSDQRALIQDLTVKHFGAMLVGFGSLMSDALPGVPAEIKRRRTAFCIQAALQTLSGPEMDAARAEGAEACEALADDLIHFLAGGLEAPVHDFRAP